jgi:hypothetical protein
MTLAADKAAKSTKHEMRNTKQYQSSKAQMTETWRQGAGGLVVGE